ncbi:MAG TPA: D-alanine--D-alanine ligase family protein [Candidatus Binatia bacterium]|nr:D-alanine--D-alanine ligase family protein [Candidatus Binatia bacterium]
MTRRLRVGVVFGGRSGEHEVSLRSAWAVIGALDPARYEVVPVAIGRDGRWRTSLDMLRMLDEAQRELGPIPESGVEVAIPPDPARRALVPVAGGNPVPLDVVFPVLHGTYGEDGTIQGLLELADVPYVGAGVLGSAAGMDKAVMKALFRDAGLPVCRSVVLAPGEVAEARVAAELGFPCFVKPANLGSSVGISKVAGPDELGAAVAEAREYDAKVVVEEAVDAREFECGVLGNDELEASVVGELVPSHEFYDYADKYVESGARIVIPAPLPAETCERMQALARRAVRAVDAAGLARVDFFLERTTGRVLVNEINTMPGFTQASMFPKLWEASGVPFAALVDRLIALALERHATRSRRRLSFAAPVPAPSARRRALR